MRMLQRHHTLKSSRLAIHRYLEAARSAVSVLPDTESRAGLAALTQFLAQQADALGNGL